MLCMKCGVEIPEDHVFCDHCLEVMKQYPIKPDVHVHLPKRSPVEEAPKKASKKKRSLTQEELLAATKMKVLRLRLAVAVLAFLLCVVSAFLALNLYQQYIPQDTGRNYTIDLTMDK